MYYAIITYIDWDYWQKAPEPLNIFILTQYVLLALTIRVPIISTMRSTTSTKITIVLVLFLLINTIIGIVWLRELT